jgi:DNA-binding NarL/FixJ family response regulator
VTHLKKGTHCNLLFSGPDQELVLYQYSGKEQKLSPKIVLSEKQKEVMALFDLMYTNRGIAMELGISEETVKSHRKKLLADFGCRDMTGLKSYLGLLEV